MPNLLRYVRMAPAAGLTLALMLGGFWGYVTGRLYGDWLLAWAAGMLLCVAFGPAVDEVVGR